MVLGSTTSGLVDANSWRVLYLKQCSFVYNAWLAKVSWWSKLWDFRIYGSLNDFIQTRSTKICWNLEVILIRPPYKTWKRPHARPKVLGSIPSLGSWMGTAEFHTRTKRTSNTIRLSMVVRFSSIHHFSGIQQCSQPLTGLSN